MTDYTWMKMTKKEDEGKKLRKRQGWYKQRKRHSIAARKGKKRAYRVFVQEHGSEAPPKYEVHRARSAKELRGSFSSYYKKLDKAGAITIRRY